LIRWGPQERRFRYDGLGRLTQQYLPERGATLDAGGRHAASGDFSDVFTYDDHANLATHTDARGIKTVYRYDALDRLALVTHEMSGFWDSANPVAPAGDVTYEYVPNGDPLRVARVGVRDVMNMTHAYDNEGRLATMTQTMTSAPTSPGSVVPRVA
jgi:YD repeat-containing protein